MTDQQTMERVQQEVVSGNKDRLYQATLKEVNMNNFNITCYYCCCFMGLFNK